MNRRFLKISLHTVCVWMVLIQEIQEVYAFTSSFSTYHLDYVQVVSLSIIGAYLIVILMRQLGVSRFLGLLSVYAGVMIVGVGAYTLWNRPPAFFEDVYQEFNPAYARILPNPENERENSKSDELKPVRIMRGHETVVFKKSRDGHFYLNLKIKGHTIPFLLDTGATRVVLTERDAQKIGIDVRSLHYKYPTQTANGVIYVAFVTIERITVGQRTLEHVPAAVSKHATPPSILGMSFLEKIPAWTIKGDRLILKLQ